MRGLPSLSNFVLMSTMARLALLALALLCVGQCRAEGLFEDGQEYQYTYLTYTLSGVREPVASGSSFGIRGNVVIQKTPGQAIVKLSDLTLGLHNGPESLLNTVRFQKKPELAPLEKPFKISYLNGKVNGFDADPSDPEWSINLKKGLATKLQLDISTGENMGKGDNAFVRVIEDTIMGSCNTSYSFSGAPAGRQMLIKQRTATDCVNVPRMSVNSFDAADCDGKFKDEMISTVQSYYQFSKASSNSIKAHVISSLGYQILQWHPPAGNPFYNLANTTLFLTKSAAISKPIAAGSLTKHYGTLRYSLKRPIPTPDEINLSREEDFLHPEEPLPQATLKTKAVGVLNKLKDLVQSAPLDEEKLSDPTVLAAVHIFQSMNLDTLNAVFNQVEKDEELRNLYIEMLPMAGSNPAALKIKDLILNGKLTDMEARRVITFIPFYLRMPTEKLLTAYEELLNENPNIKTKELRGSIAMAFGHLIGAACNPAKGRTCKTDTINKYGRMAYDSFKNAKTHPEMMVTLQALRNTKQPSLIEKLIPLTKSGASSHAIRPHVIYALQTIGRTNRNKFLAAVMPIILNVTETTEIRVAAISALFQTKPTFLELQQLVNAAIWERNVEVLNFLMTSFKNMADSKSPCIKPFANNLQLLLRRLSHIKTNHFRSSNRVFDFQDQKYGFGGGLQLVTVYGEESRAPVIIAGRVNYRVSDYNYQPLEILIRLEGVEDTFVKFFRALDPKDFKLDVLKDLLLKTLKIKPRTQAPLKVELLVRSQGFSVMYRHLSMEEIAAMAEGKGSGLRDMIAVGVKLTRSNIMLGGQHSSWRANDVGLPVGVGMSTPGFARNQFAYGTVNQPGKIGRSLVADLDFTFQTVTYLVAYNPLGVSQGIVKVRGSRLHLPINALVGFSPADQQVELKVNTPTEEEPLAYVFKSQTAAFMWGKDDSKALVYLKDTCSECEQNSLVTRGPEFRKGRVMRDKNNQILGLESHIEVYNCETYTGKASVSKVLLESFKPSEINSHGSPIGFVMMGVMQMRNYFYYYPPTGTCSMKAVVHKTSENPSNAAELKLKMDHAVPAGRKAAPGREFTNVKGSLTLLGSSDRKWNIDVNVESELMDVKSSVNVKLARLANPSLDLPARALCVNVKTEWAPLPLDVMETPSTTEPSVQRDVQLVWGQAPANECPKANAKDVSTLIIKTVGNITEAQKKAASDRNAYPFDRCDLDRTDAGRTGVTTPMTEACLEAVLDYSTPRSYVYDIHYENMSPSGMMALHRADTVIKGALLPYWDMHAPHGATAVKKAPNAGHIEIKMEYGEEDVDIHVHTAIMHSHYENVEILRNADMLLRNGRLPTALLMAVKAQWVGVCDVAPKAIVTFDNVTLSYDLPSCYTLVSADCSPSPRYAVLARKTGQTLPLAAKIYIGGHTVELAPTGSNVEVKVNDKVVKLEGGKPHVVGDKDNIVQYFTVTKVGPKFYVRAPLLKLSFRYTGDDITNMIPATHRAQHCGVCGDYNGQNSRELIGPNGCNLKDATDLARSYVVRDKNCKDTIPTPACETSGAAEKKPAGIVEFLDQFSNMEELDQ